MAAVDTEEDSHPEEEDIHNQVAAVGNLVQDIPAVGTHPFDNLVVDSLFKIIIQNS